MSLAENNRKSSTIMLAIFFPLAIALGSILASCNAIRSPGKLMIKAVSQPPEGKFLFVESWVIRDGTGHLGGGFVDRPTYWFNPTKKELHAGYLRGEYPSGLFMGLYGQGESWEGAVGSGAGSALTVMPALPFTTTIRVSYGQIINYGLPEMVSMPVELLAVSVDGKLEIKVAGEATILAVGKCWRRLEDTIVYNSKLRGQLFSPPRCRQPWRALRLWVPRLERC